MQEHYQFDDHLMQEHQHRQFDQQLLVYHPEDGGEGETDTELVEEDSQSCYQ